MHIEGKQLSHGTLYVRLSNVLIQSQLNHRRKIVSVDLSAQPAGTYFIRIQTGFGEVKTVKFVREK